MRAGKLKCLVAASIVSLLALEASSAGRTETFGFLGITTDANYDQVVEVLSSLGKVTRSENASTVFEPQDFPSHRRVVLVAGTQGQLTIGFEEIEPSRMKIQFSTWMESATERYGPPLKAENSGEIRTALFCHSPRIGLFIFTSPTSSGIAYRKTETVLPSCANVKAMDREALLADFPWAADSGAGTSQNAPGVTPSSGGPPRPSRSQLAQTGNVTVDRPKKEETGRGRSPFCDAIDQVINQADRNWVDFMGASNQPEPGFRSNFSLPAASGCQVNNLLSSSYVCSFGWADAKVGKERVAILSQIVSQCLEIEMRAKNFGSPEKPYEVETDIVSVSGVKLNAKVILVQDSKEELNYRILFALA